MVGVDVVRELFGVMAAKGAAGGFVVTSGTFTADASAFASGRDITLVDGPELHAMIRRVQGADAARPGPPAQPAAARSGQSSTSSCPICQSTMVRRAGKSGALAGKNFWGCSRYPACRGTRPMADT